MNITCDRELLQKYISYADRITGKHLSLPVLGLILLTAENKTLHIRATNLEVGVEFQIPATIKTGGTIALPGGLVANILSGITDEKEVNLSVVNGICKIITKSKNLTIKGFPSEDFPTIPLVSDGEKFSIPSTKFIHGIKSVMVSASISDIKPEISSIYIHKIAESLVFTATDSFRLSEKKINLPKINFSQNIIIPIKNITEIIKIIDQVNEEIIFTVSKNQISCAGNHFYITSRVVQGVYPDYEQILPKTHTTEVLILKQDLINTLKLSTLFSDKFNGITFIVDPKKKICLISTKNSDVGEIESNITATISGDPITLSLNGKHVFDSLSAIEKDSVVIRFNGVDKPVIISGLGDPSFTYLTMPITR